MLPFETELPDSVAASRNGYVLTNLCCVTQSITSKHTDKIKLLR